MGNDSFVGVVVVLCISILIFLICREIFCWYWKVNRIVELLEQIARQKSNEIPTIQDSNIDLKINDKNSDGYL